MIVRVSAHHIAHGSRQNHFHNPLALAVNDAFTDKRAVVTQERVHRQCEHGQLCTGKFCGIHTLPYAAQQWLREYNAGHSVSPFTFTLY